MITRGVLLALIVIFVQACNITGMQSTAAGGREEIMDQSTTSPYGEWVSPISSDLIVAASIGLSSPSFDGEDIYWLEGRPQENGRTVLVRRSVDGRVTDLTPAPFNLRSRVHEYGGGAYLVADGIAYFSNFGDNKVYRLKPGEEAVAISNDSAMRYADFRLIANTSRLVAVREDHSGQGEAINTLVTLERNGSGSGSGAGTVIASGNDFYAAPRPSPDGTRLAWLAWDHPNMPWDGTQLWLADVNSDGTLENKQQVAGGTQESIFQPEWSPGGVLHFVSDRSGWWNLYRRDGVSTQPLYPTEAEFGQPVWIFGSSTYGFESDDSIVCAYRKNGSDQLARLDTTNNTLQDIDSVYTSINGIQVQNGRQVFIGGGATTFSGVVLRNNSGGAAALRLSNSLTLDERSVSAAQAIEFPTGNDRTAHAFYYPPQNRDHLAPDGAKPPLLVFSHGGPTGATSATLALSTQYWTSRGFAVVDVNYGGSTGFGTAYRRRLNGQWGIVDVEDSVSAANYLVKLGLADGERLAIRGGSAGGYTTLAALTFSDTFKAGASYYGISDIEVLAADTHKFESRYVDSLIGPYPQEKQVYHDRSPINHLDQLSSPVIFFQGLDDKVVPPNQAQMMFEALKKKGLATAYLPFEGEGHGFRQAKNQKRALDAELYFYGRVFGFTPADAIEPVDIVNMEPQR